MHVFGLTGGIASGKSMVLGVFRAGGVATVDADEMARRVVEPGSEGLAAIVSAFGDAVLLEGGALDRKKLASLVFGDEQRRRTLNGIVHPRVALATQARFTELAAEGATLGCYDAALLVETGLAAMFRPLVVVAAPRAMQHARLVARDGLTAAEADARLDAQAPLEAKLAAADVVIWNDADVTTIETRAREALARVQELIAKPA
ncbi:MAG: dephospho-CoA kinase [Polyangiales bacterium]